MMETHIDGRHLEFFKNGLFGAIEVFNKLSEDVVQLLDVHDFQRALTKTARLALKDGNPRWAYIFSGRVYFYFCSHCLFFFVFFCFLECVVLGMVFVSLFCLGVALIVLVDVLRRKKNDVTMICRCNVCVQIML